MEDDELEFIRTSIRRIHRHFQARLQAQVERLGFTLPQMRVLQKVVAEPGLAIKDLAAALDLSQSTVSGIVDRLADKKVIAKRVHPDDRRAVQIWPTDAVNTFMAIDRAEFVTRPVREVLDGLPPETGRLIVEALSVLMARVNAVGSEFLG